MSRSQSTPISSQMIGMENIIAKLEQQRNELAAQVEGLRAALHKLACLGNGDTYGNSTGNRIAQDALALPNTTADILRKRDARTLRDAADDLGDVYRVGASSAAVWLMHRATELENGK